MQISLELLHHWKAIQKTKWRSSKSLISNNYLSEKRSYNQFRLKLPLNYPFKHLLKSEKTLSA